MYSIKIPNKFYLKIRNGRFYELRKITNKDEVFDQLMTEEDMARFQLFELIRMDDASIFYTDDESFISAQSNENTPLWIFSNQKLEEQALSNIQEIIHGATDKKRDLPIIMDTTLAKRLDCTLKEHMPMIVYTCEKSQKIEEIGEMVMPKEEYAHKMADLITQMEKDIADVELTKEEADVFARSNLSSRTLFLWKEKEIVAMAKVAHFGKKYARINTVVTDQSQRGKGYAKMLVGTICEQLLQQNFIPLLYADARNPSSNSCYKRIGFHEIGKIFEYMKNE